MIFNSLEKLKINNRLAVAPMTRISATREGIPTKEMLSYYNSFAKGGFGLIITEGLFIDKKYSPGYENQPGIVDESQINTWRKIVKTVQKNDSKIIAQLMHAGALVHGNVFGYDSVAPSSIRPKGEKSPIYKGKGKYPMPNTLTSEDISKIISHFVQAAKNAKISGFDGVEIHGANGYLLDQFLTDYTNNREDKYGGSLEKRLQLLLDVLKSVVSELDPEFIVGVRISQSKVNDFYHKWAGGEQDAKLIFKSIEQTGVDYIHVTEHKAWLPAFKNNESSLVFLAKKFTGLPIIANGSLDDPIKAQDMINNGIADVIALGKGALSNHDWPKKVARKESLTEFNPDTVLKPYATLKPFEL